MSSGPPLLNNIVQLSLLERVRPEYLLSFLRPFAGYLGGKDVVLDGVALDHDWIGHLHAVLCAVDPEMPSKLQQALLDIAGLAGDQAHEQILELAGERQLSLFHPGGELCAEDLAFKLYLEHGDLFAASHARVQSKGARRFVEFFACDDAPLDEALSEAKRVLLTDQLGRWFGTRNCTDYSEVRVSEQDGEVTFLVIHGRTPRSCSVITADGARGRTSFVPDSQDTLVYDKGTCRLSVNARWPAEQDFYRQAVGHVFFGDSDHFAAHEIYTGAPIAEEGAQSLSPAGIHRLDEVVLQRIEVRDGSTPPQVLLWRGADLGAELGSETARAFLDGREITYLKLGMRLRGRRRRVPVEITPPNKLTYDRRIGDGVVREFLLVRGFMKLPARDELPAAASG